MGKNNSDINIGAVITGSNNEVNVDGQKYQCVPCNKQGKVSPTTKDKTYCHDCIRKYKSNTIAFMSMVLFVGLLFSLCLHAYLTVPPLSPTIKIFPKVLAYLKAALPTQLYLTTTYFFMGTMAIAVILSFILGIWRDNSFQRKTKRQ